MIGLYRSRLYGSGSLRPSLIPDEVLEEMDSSDLVVYIPSMSGNSMFSPAGVELPEGEAWMAATSDAGGFALRGRFVLRDETAGAGFTRAVKLLLLYLLKKIEVEDLGSRLGKLEVGIEGKRIRVDGLALSSEEMKRLVQWFVAGERVF
jgi:hypothetical protein